MDNDCIILLVGSYWESFILTITIKKLQSSVWMNKCYSCTSISMPQATTNTYAPSPEPDFSPFLKQLLYCYEDLAELHY